MIYRARHLVTMDGPPVENGAVAVREEFIAAAGPWVDVQEQFPGESVTDLGEVTLLPGFINAHCHLDYSTLRNAILPPASFSEWVGRINALKRTLDAEDYLAAIARGFAESARWGTTTILNIESFPELMWKMPPPPLRTWWFYEMIDVRRVIPTEELVAGALFFFQEMAQGQGPAQWHGGSGLSPHAPYTASAELYRLARDCARQNGMPWTTHLGESADEQEMFVHGRGPLYRFLAGLGRPMRDCGHGHSALATLTASGCLGPECIAVHLNDWEEEDFTLVAPGGPLAGMTVVHCPLSHRYFRHRAFPLERLRASGVNVCVGTDSPASNGSFSLLEEIRALAGVFSSGAPRGSGSPGRVPTKPDASEMPAMTDGSSPTEPGKPDAPGVMPGAPLEPPVPGASGAPPSPLEPRALLAMITVNPARALGLEGRLGCVRPGAWADLAALPCGGPGNIYAEVLDCRAPASWLMIHGRVI